MTIRRWFYLTVGLCAVSLYVSVVNVFNPSGVLLYVLGGLAVVGVLYIGVLVYRGGDTQQVALKLKHEENTRSSVFADGGYTLMVERSDSPVTQVSDLVKETFTEQDMQRMFQHLTDWKATHAFTWDESTLYDTLAVVATPSKTAEGSVQLEVVHTKRTKQFVVKGVLHHIPTDKCDQMYSISGLHFRLTNVFEDDLGKSGEWTLCVDHISEAHRGVIVNKVFDEGGQL